MDEGCGGARPKNLYTLGKNKKSKERNSAESNSSLRPTVTRSLNINRNTDNHKCTVKPTSVKSSRLKSSSAKGRSHDLVKAKEHEYLTAKERWKKSGLALRRYIAEKLGFKNDKKINVPISEADKVSSKREVVTSSSDKGNSQKFSMASISDSHLYQKALPLTEMSRSKSFLEKMGFKQDKRKEDHLKHKVKYNKDFELDDMESSSCCMDLSTWSEGSCGFGRQDCSDTQSSLDSYERSGQVKAGFKTEVTQNYEPSTKKGVKLQSNKKEKTEKTKNVTKKRKEKTKAILCISDIALDRNLDDSEFVYDPDLDEIVCRKIECKPESLSQPPPRIGSPEGARSGERHLSSAMSNAVAGLQYAIPYLPERFRRLGCASETQDTKPETGALAPAVTRTELHASKPEPVNLKYVRKANKKPVHKSTDSVEKTPTKDSKGPVPAQTHRHKNKLKKDNEDEEHWKKRLASWANAGPSNNEVGSEDHGLNGRLFALSSIRDENSEDALFQNEYAGQLEFESSLEDPFHVRERNTNTSIDLCTGLLDLVNDIDEPLTDHRHFESDAPVSQRAFDRRFLNNSSHSSVSNHVTCRNCLRGICLCHDECFVPCVEDGLECRSSDDDLDQKYVEQILERSRHRSSGDSFELSFRNNLSSPLEEPSNKSKEASDRPSAKCAFEDISSPGSGLSSFNSSLDADDEFECECEHCQMMRSSHNHYTEQLALTQPLSLDLSERSQGGYASAGQDSGLHFSFGDANLNSRSGDSSFDSLSRRMFMDDYDFLLMERPVSELDWHWLTIDNTPLSVMLEDVIQQMLSVQPDLLSEQAAPPAPSSVIDSLPTVCLNQELIEQHQCCAICLCPCEVEEVMTQLLCQHIFHPLCIQAWLCKSGTCPVCRGKVGAPDQP